LKGPANRAVTGKPVPVLSVLWRMTVDYGDRQETIDGGRAHHFAPGQLPTVQTDCEAVESTPTEGLEQTMEAVRRNEAAGETLGG
jgi:hypothetical protein